MVTMHAPKRKEALHAPTHPRPLPGGEQTFVRAAKVPLLGGVRGGFMVPMHAQTRKEAFHEPERGAPAPRGPARRGHNDRAGLEPRAPIPRFMVAMHGQKRKEG